MSAEYGETVTIPCTVTSAIVPEWTIGYSNGTTIHLLNFQNLPAYFKFSYEGIQVSVEDLKLNLTNYSCSIHYILPDLNSGIFTTAVVQSRTGVLTINFPFVVFRLLSQHDTGVHSAHVREGETINFRVIKEGGENYTYYVTVHSTGMSRLLNFSSDYHYFFYLIL